MGFNVSVVPFAFLFKSLVTGGAFDLLPPLTFAPSLTFLGSWVRQGYVYDGANASLRQKRFSSFLCGGICGGASHLLKY